MTLEVRPIAEGDFKAWFEAVWTAFGEELVEESIERDKKVFELERTFGIYDGKQIVGGGGTFSFQITVPGGALMPTGGVTAVGVMPTHRRQGALRQLMLAQLADGRARGESALLLWASEGSIYQRFGYGLASLAAGIDIERDRATFREPADWTGSVRLIDAAEAAKAFPPIHDALAAVTPGFYQRNEAWWESQILADPPHWRAGSGKKNYLLNERDGKPVGYATYRIKSEYDDVGTKSVLRVVETMAIDPAATRDIWRYLFGVDLIHRVTYWPGPADNPLLLMLNEPRRLQLRFGDGLWLRIIDVPAALRTRTYAADGELVVEVQDTVLPDVAGRWKLTVREGRAEVASTDQPADLRLDITDLGAIYLGGFSASDLARAGRGAELTAGALRRAEAMFASDRAPWCPHVF